MNDNGRVRLVSWKEIAAYLRREVRTVIRWEKERGLPVHRVPGGQGGSVFAFTDELDRWAAGESSKEAIARKAPFRRRAAFAVAAAAVALISALATGLARALTHREIARVSAIGSSIDAFDRDGRRLWSFAIPGRAHHLPRRQTQLIDLNGNGRVDALVTTSVAANPEDAGIGRLYAISDNGELLWERSLDTRLTFGAGDFEAPWQPDDLLAFTNGGEPLTAWAVHHHTWWPSILTVFDARGVRLGAFAQSGWIRSARASADGLHIITGGFSNSRNGAAFAVLDARAPTGASPEDAGSPYECRNCPAGQPQRYFTVDWSDIATSLPPDERDAVVAVYPGRGTIELRAVQRRSVDLIVELSPSFEIAKRSVSDAFWESHRRLEKNGTLAHGRDACPYRNGPIVHEWTPSGGWRTHGAE